MIDLDQIEQRIGRGQVTPADIQSLATEADSLKLSIGSVLERVGRGYSGASEVAALFGAVEAAYSVLYKRPTAAQRRQSDLAAQAAAVAQANADRVAASLAQAAAEDAARLAWQSTAQTVEAERSAAIEAKSTVERFNAAKAASDELLKEKAKKKRDLEDTLDAGTPPVVGPNDNQA